MGMMMMVSGWMGGFGRWQLAISVVKASRPGQEFFTGSQSFLFNDSFLKNDKS